MNMLLKLMRYIKNCLSKNNKIKLADQQKEFLGNAPHYNKLTNEYTTHSTHTECNRLAPMSYIYIDELQNTIGRIYTHKLRYHYDVYSIHNRLVTCCTRPYRDLGDCSKETGEDTLAIVAADSAESVVFIAADPVEFTLLPAVSPDVVDSVTSGATTTSPLVVSFASSMEPDNDAAARRPRVETGADAGAGATATSIGSLFLRFESDGLKITSSSSSTSFLAAGADLAVEAAPALTADDVDLLFLFLVVDCSSSSADSPSPCTNIG
jgi:hypothetical protein